MNMLKVLTCTNIYDSLVVSWSIYMTIYIVLPLEGYRCNNWKPRILLDGVFPSLNIVKLPEAIIIRS